MKIAASYIRVSDERQDEYSPNSQLTLIREYAQKNGFTVPEQYIFYDDGVSAKSTRGRDSFNEMIALAERKDHPFEAIIVWKFSRFSRNIEDSILLKSRLRRNGVSILSVSEQINENDEYSGLIERFIEWDDAHYLRRLSQEVKRGMKEKASRGEPMARQYGYDLIKKQLYINDNSETVRDIFASFLSGEGMRAIAQRLGSAGVVTSRGNVPDSRWVEYILHNPVYIGKIRWSLSSKAASRRDYDSSDIMLVDGRHEPIIDFETWDKTQKKLAEQSKKYGKYQRAEQSVDWMLKGLVRCSTCGATLVRASFKCPSMQCHNYGRGKCHISHSLSLAKAGGTVEQMILSMPEIKFTIEPKKQNKRETDYGRLIDAERRRLKKITEAYRSGIDTLEEYGEAKASVLKKIEAMEKERMESEAITVSENDSLYRKKTVLLSSFFADEGVSEKAKNEALRLMISGITYRKSDGCLEVLFRL